MAGFPMCIDMGITTSLGAGILTGGISAVVFLWGTCTPGKKNRIIFILSVEILITVHSQLQLYYNARVVSRKVKKLTKNRLKKGCFLLKTRLSQMQKCILRQPRFQSDSRFSKEFRPAFLRNRRAEDISTP